MSLSDDVLLPEEQLRSEQITNQRYLREIGEKVLPVSSVTRSRSSDWTGVGRPQVDRPVSFPLAGRVALDAVDEDLGRDFYVGPCRLDQGSLQVVSWAAPIAAAFFGDAPTQLQGQVVLRRTLIPHGDSIVDLEDDWAGKPLPSHPFAGRVSWNVPRPPPRRAAATGPRHPAADVQRPSPAADVPRQRPSPAADVPEQRPAPAADVPLQHPVPAASVPEQRPTPAADVAQPRPTSAADVPLQRPVPAADVPQQPPAPAADVQQQPLTPAVNIPRERPAPAAPSYALPPPAQATDGLRAAGAVVRALEAPRQSRLTSVLSTLQADQYDLVRRPAAVPLIIQGHPGTGKTIVAVHRAAFLSDPESGQAVASVLLAGPGPEYVRHVRALTEAMSPLGRVTVSSIPEILQGLACLPKLPVGPLDGTAEDVSAPVAQLAASVVRALRASEGAPLEHSRANVRRAYRSLRETGDTTSTVRLSPKQRAWVSGLPAWEDARRLPRYLPLLAALGQQLQGSGQRFDHVVVDEAQDVRPLEWQVLRGLVTGQGLTLLGDMNQRRSDHTHRTWRAVAKDLDLSDGDTLLQPVLVTRGYRSTGAILAFAGRLLPPRERRAECIRRGGTPPGVVAVEEGELHGAVIAEATAALHRHPTGTVAVVTRKPADVQPALRQAGWKRSQVFAHQWERGDDVLSVLGAEAARGLEFDVVVVAEPADYPESSGRLGLLYTSLTRGNQELVVVHARALPPALRAVERAERPLPRSRMPTAA